jgi:hypothetical protein
MKISNHTELIILKNILSNILKVPLNGDLPYTYLNKIIEDEIVLTEEQFLVSLRQIELLLIKTILADFFKESVYSPYFLECVCYRFFSQYLGGVQSEEQLEIFSNQTNEPEHIMSTLNQISRSYKDMLVMTT